MKSILLLLALMVSNIVNASSERARLTAAHTDIANLTVKLDKFAGDCGRYPTTSEGVSALIHCPTNIPTARWHGPYLDTAQTPIDPWGNEYDYSFPGLHNKSGFDLYSCGADGISRSGGNDDDDVNNWDFFSPRGTFSERVKTFAGTAIISLFIIALLLGVGLLVTAVFSRRVRDFNARHPAVHDVCLWTLLVGGLILLLLCMIPRIA